MSLRALRASVVETPEILHHAEHVPLPGLDAQQVINLKLDGTKEAELYRLLLVARCNALHEAMPFLFEKIADDTELLLPDNLLHSDSVIRKLVKEIEEADWQQVEIIGWLYQFYISDEKDEVIGKVVKSEDIPAATQLFTPNWIVKYLVQNTLGRQWLATYPDSPLRQQMEYYIEPAEQTEEVKAQLAAITPKSLDPEKLTLLDPASGSGHILVEAYDLFKTIYQERGYRSKDIPRLILQKNLYGLEIDDRAAQLAAFALMMKARADDRRIFADHIQPNVVAIQESKGLEELLNHEGTGFCYHGDTEGTEKAKRGTPPFAEADLFAQTVNQPLLQATPQQQSSLSPCSPCLRGLITLFEHGKTFGSLIRVPPDLAAQLPIARQGIEAMIAAGQLWEHHVGQLLLRIVKQAELLAKTHDALVTNPPYMGGGALNPDLKRFLKKSLPSGKNDLYAAFMLRSVELISQHSHFGMITFQNWMFISSFDQFRLDILEVTLLSSLIHCGRGVWGADFGTCAFIFERSTRFAQRGVFQRLFVSPSKVQSNEQLSANFFNKTSYPVFVTASQQFRRIEGVPIAYWLSERDLECFGKPALKTVAESGGRCKTHDDERFVRFFWKVDFASISKEGKWKLLAHGGDFRRWYGNRERVFDWSASARKEYASHGGLSNLKFWSRTGISWSDVTIAQNSFRLKPDDSEYSSLAPTLMPIDPDHTHMVLGFLNTGLARNWLRAINPTLHANVGDVLRLPFIAPDGVNDFVKAAVVCAREDWDSFETSMEFHGSPLRREHALAPTLASSWHSWRDRSDASVRRMIELETEINRRFIAAFNICEEISPDVPRDQIPGHGLFQRPPVHLQEAAHLLALFQRQTAGLPVSRLPAPLQRRHPGPDADGIRDPVAGQARPPDRALAGDIAAATSTSHRKKLEKQRETLVKQRTELASFDEKLRHYADQRIALDLDDGVKVDYGRFGDLLAEVKAVTGGREV